MSQILIGHAEVIDHADGDGVFTMLEPGNPIPAEADPDVVARLTADGWVVTTDDTVPPPDPEVPPETETEPESKRRKS